MDDKKRLLPSQALQGTQLELASTNTNLAVELRDDDVEAKAHIQAARLTHNEQETNLRATDTKVMANKESARAQFTAVDMKAKNNKAEVSLTQVNVQKDKNNKAVVTAANVTKDAEGKTRAAAITTAGAGETFDVPIKGNKEISGVKVTHKATVLTEDEHGEQKVFHVFSISPYNTKIRAERCIAVRKGIELSSKIPHHVKLRVCWKLSLLIFYTFLFFYPLITFLVERQYVLYNLVCIAIGGIGFGLQIFEFDQLYADLKKTWLICRHGCCRSAGFDSTEDYDEESNDGDDGTCKCKKFLCSYCLRRCPGVIRELFSIILNEILLYATLICTLMGFINEKTWELQSFWSYFDCILLLYSIIMEVLVPRLYYIRWLNGAISTLLTEYVEARYVKKCSCYGMYIRYVTPLRYTPIFVIFVILLQTFMLGAITARMYADNYFAQTNTTRNGTEYITEVIIPKEGMYHVKRYTWYAIVCGIVVPFLSIATYFIINQYWLWQPLHYTGQHHSGFVPKNTMIGSMSDMDKWIIFAFDPVAWVAMVLLLASFIAFCVFIAGNDYDGKSVLSGMLPHWINGIYIVSYIFICLSFIGANTQTVAFGLLIFLQPFCLCVVLVQAFRRPRYRVH